MKALRFGMACALVATSFSTSAVVVIADKDDPGDQGVLFDTSTGLDWARGPTELAGGAYEGFRLASSDEASIFFEDVFTLAAPLPPPPGHGEYTGLYEGYSSKPPYDPLPAPYRPAFDVLWSIWNPGDVLGISRALEGKFFLTADLPTPITGGLTFGLLSLSHTATFPLETITFAADASFGTSSEPPRGAGRALVRIHVDVVPEPETYVLMMIGVASLALAARRGRRLRGASSGQTEAAGVSARHEATRAAGRHRDEARVFSKKSTRSLTLCLVTSGFDSLVLTQPRPLHALGS